MGGRSPAYLHTTAGKRSKEDSVCVNKNTFESLHHPFSVIFFGFTEAADMTAEKRKIDLTQYTRRSMFEAFRDRQFPCFSTTCNIEITDLKRWTAAKNHTFFITMSYVISRAVNGIPELRHRLIEGDIYEFEKVDPGYTVLLQDNTFSFCDAVYFENFGKYYDCARQKIEEVKQRPDSSTGDKNHMFFITNIPWFSFTSFTHPYEKQYGTIPIITLGKYFQQGEHLLLPLSIQVHHGVVDGFHVGLFYQAVNRLAAAPERFAR